MRVKTVGFVGEFWRTLKLIRLPAMHFCQVASVFVVLKLGVHLES